MGNQDLQEKIQIITSKVQDNKYIASISKGLSSMMPIILAGAIFILLDSLNFDFWQSFLVQTGLKEFTAIPSAVTLDMLSIYVVFGVANAMAREFNRDGVAAGSIALLSFLILTPMGAADDGTVFLSMQWLGAAGLFVALIVGLAVGRLLVFIMNKEMYIRMPEGVPPNISRAFEAVMPAFISVFLMLVVRGIFAVTPFENIHEFIYSIVQAPLTALGGQWWSYLIVTLVMCILWFFGIHGTLAVLGIMMPIWTTLGLENLEAYQAGAELPHIITGTQFFLVYTAIGGTGATIGLAALFLGAKSKRYRTLGKLAIVPALTGINEPIFFGTPLVLNIKLLIPLLVAPLVTSSLAIVATVLEIVPRLNGIGVPLGTPIILSGIISGGWRVAVLQVILAGVSALIWYPFFRIIDKEAVADEKVEVPVAETAETFA